MILTMKFWLNQLREKDDFFTDKTVDIDTSEDNDTIHDSDINTLNERINHDIQSTYGDRNGIQIINYGDDDQKIDISDQIILVTKKPIYESYKDVCSNNIITHGSNTITQEGNNSTHGNTPLVASE